MFVKNWYTRGRKKPTNMLYLDNDTYGIPRWTLLFLVALLRAHDRGIVKRFTNVTMSAIPGLHTEAEINRLLRAFIQDIIQRLLKWSLPQMILLTVRTAPTTRRIWHPFCRFYSHSSLPIIWDRFIYCRS